MFSEDREFVHRELTHRVLACAYEVHRVLGPGLLENAYKTCLSRELLLSGLDHRAETAIPIGYKGVTVETGYRADLVVDGKVLIELKAVERLLAIHEAQVLTYLRLSGVRVGLLINFNVTSLKTGIRRFIRKADVPGP